MTVGLFLNGEFINPEIVSGDLDAENRYAVAKAETIIKKSQRWASSI
ncbi:MAG: hypothetical protein R2788_16135 [Saprospiraceae bacterium]